MMSGGMQRSSCVDAFSSWRACSRHMVTMTLVQRPLRIHMYSDGTMRMPIVVDALLADIARVCR